MAKNGHDDDYSDLLSAEERAELAASRRERNLDNDSPAPTLREAAQEILETFVKPLKPYLRYHEIGRAPTADNYTGDFLHNALASDLKAAGAYIRPLPNLTANVNLPPLASIQQGGGIGPLGGGAANASPAGGVHLSPEDAQRLLPLIRQIVREEIEYYETERYRRVRVNGGYTSGRNI